MMQKFEEVNPRSRPIKCFLLSDEKNPISKTLKIEAVRVFLAKRFFLG